VFPIRVSVVSGRLATREVTETVNRKLRLLRLSDDVLSTCELVLSEVLNNVVEHAYPEGDPPGPITVECIDLPDGLKFTVIDQGVGMPGGRSRKRRRKT
jgi:serine/threonine-protein kinase RsbW